jgi:hypothetical protein
MNSLFAEICDIIEPMIGLGSWHGVPPELHGGDPVRASILALGCPACLHYGPPDITKEAYLCEYCGAELAHRYPEVVPHQWRWPEPEPVPRLDYVQNTAWAQRHRRVYRIKDLGALKAAFLEARAKHRERLVRPMRSSVEAETERPQPGVVGALSFPH